MLPVVDQGADARSRCSPEARRHRRFLLVLLVLSVALLWLPPLTSSFWVDETWTFWAISDGLWEAIDRAQRFHAASAMYFAVTWCVKQVGGSSEWVLRLPSVAAAGLTVLVIYQLGVRLVDRETGVLAGIVFACSELVAFAACDARPYALAVLTVTAAVYCLVEWLRDGRRRYVLAYALLAALSVHLQVMFAAMFPVHVFYIWRVRRSAGVRDLRAVWGLVALTLILLLPLAPEAWSYLTAWWRLWYAERPSWIGTPTVLELALVCVPPVITFALLIGVVVASAVSPAFDVRWRALRVDGSALLLSWAFVPPVLLFAVSVFSPAKLLVPRYALCAAPGFSLLAACLIRAAGPARVRRMLAQIVVGVSLASHFGMHHGAEGWRSAVAETRRYVLGKSIPVLLRSGLADASDVDLLSDPGRRSSVLTPLAAYELDAEIIPLPWNLGTPAQLQYMERVASNRLARADGFVLITRAFGDNGSFAAWLLGRLAPLGFCSRSLGNFGAVQASAFERSPEACGNPD